MSGQPSRARAKTFYVPDDVQVILQAGAAGNLSASMCRKLRRYAEIVSKSRPSLSDAEWGFVRMALRTYRAETADHLRGMGAIIKAWQTPPGEPRPYGVDPSNLGFRVEGLPIAQLAALIEDVEAHAIPIAPG